jgi:glycosyltransferase involved in cell wall biosynthesis
MIVQNYYDRDIRVRRKAEALVEAGYSVDVFALRSPDRPKAYTLNGVHVRTVSLGKRRGSLARYVYEYGAFLAWATASLTARTRKRRYALVDVNTLPDFLVFAAAPARRMGARVLLDLHEITPEFFMSKYRMSERSLLIRLLKRQERASIRAADHVLTINEPIQELLVGRGLSRARTTVLTNSADEARFAWNGQPPDGLQLSAKPEFVLMYHGTLTDTYGLDIAIEAFARAHDRMPGAELWILGDGPEAAPLGALAQRHRLQSKVRLPGVVPPSDIPAWLAACSVGILPFRRDAFLDFAFPNKLPEFIVAGKPVLVSRLNAIRHYFGEDALAFCEPDDPDALAERMIELYADDALRARLVERATEQYAPIRWAVMKERYLALVAALIGTRSASAG